MNYEYCDENRIENPISYSFSKFEGEDFVKAYFESRTNRLKQMDNSENLSVIIDTIKKDPNNSETKKELILLLEKSDEFDICEELSKWTKRFEISKKIYANYNPLGEGKFNCLTCYSLLGISLGKYYLKSKNLKFLNALLKINDLLCSADETEIKMNTKKLMHFSISNEIKVVKELYHKKGLKIK